jgi:hypothetical protein
MRTDDQIRRIDQQRVTIGRGVRNSFSANVVSTSESYTFTLDGNVTLVADFK